MQRNLNRRLPRPPRSLVIFLAIITIALTAWAQNINSQVEGRVQDISGAVIPAAHLILTNVNTGVKQTTQTNNKGLYIFPAVPVGEYTLQISKTGFQTYVMSKFTVVLSQTATENVVLKVGAVTQSVTVQAGGATPLLEPNSNQLGTLISPRQVAELPLNGLNFLQLGLLSGATQPSTGADFVAAQGGHPGLSINVGGQEQDYTSYMIDGMPMSGSRMGNASINPSIAGISQFKVQHGYFLPSLGPDPSIVNVITKAGTNQFHGELFEYLRNNALDSRGYFDTTALPPFHRNQFGASAGGPIIKNKLFIFGDYQGLRQSLTNQGRGFTPTAAMFKGDFSALLPNTVIYNPYTFDSATGTRQPFPGNIIPAKDLNSVAKNLLAYYEPGSSLASKPFNYFTTVPTTLNADQGTVRVDEDINSHNEIFGVFSDENSPQAAAGLFPLSGLSHPLDTKLAMIQWTSTLSPTMVNVFHVGWTRDLIFQQGQPSANLATQIGIPGTADPNGVPGVGLTGFSGFGRSAGNLGNIDNLYQIHDGLSDLIGKHQLQFGFGLRYVRSIQQSANANARGSLGFQDLYTAQLQPNGSGGYTAVPGTGSAFADFLLGMPFTGTVVSMPRTHYRWTQFDPYIQDSWKIRSNLTLNLGFSWYLATAPNPVGQDRNYPHAFDFQTGKVLFAALGQIRPSVYPTDYHDFIPRIGVAWSPSFVRNTVVRAGFGIYYASQRLLDQQFSIVGPGVSITQSFANSATAPMPTYMLGKNVFTPITTTPITQAFANSLTSGTIFDYSTNALTPYVEQWTFGIQHTFGSNNLVEVDYLGSEGHRLNRRSNPDDCSVPNSYVCNPAAIPYPNFRMLYSSNTGGLSYEALVAKFQHQFSHGLSFIANYTWSKTLTNAMVGATAGSLSEMSHCPKCDIGLAPYNVPQRLVTSVIYQLPLGRGQLFLRHVNPIVNHVIDGWSVDTIATFQGGNPFTVTAPNTTGLPFINFRANRLCNGRTELKNKNLRTNGGYFFDTSCFAAPPVGYFGNSGNYILSGPGLNNWDIGLHKDIPIRESLRMQFRTEFFNAFNHAQFGNPDSGVGGSNFGKVTSTQQPGREIQFALSLLW